MMAGGQQPIIILKEGTKREKGKGAQLNNIMAARAISDAVKSTLGPKGMDKMLVDSMGDVVITNDGATILKEIDVETTEETNEDDDPQRNQRGNAFERLELHRAELNKKARATQGRSGLENESLAI